MERRRSPQSEANERRKLNCLSVESHCITVMVKAISVEPFNVRRGLEILAVTIFREEMRGLLLEVVY